MIIIRSLDNMPRDIAPVYLAAGFFDGVHTGHRHVIGRAVEEAQRAGGHAWVMTFETHPMQILRPELAPLMLTSLPHKLRLIEACGVDGCLLLPFTRALASQSAHDFADQLFHNVHGLSGVIVGENWRFGHKAVGTPGLLASLGAEANVSVITIPAVCHGGLPVSSTRIRDIIARGDLDTAADMLGRPHSVLGTVVRGRQLGRQLGYPSANLDPHNEVLPPQGIYAALAWVNGRLHEGVLNYGTCPTIDPSPEAPSTLELHLLEYSGDLYGQDIEAFFIDYLRPEACYASHDELKTQIGKDINLARACFEAAPLAKKLKESLYMTLPAYYSPAR